MAVTLNQNSAALDQLRTINLMAQSSSFSTAGNIGMVGDQVVKFNTHWQERRSGVVTDGMRDSCQALRKTINSLLSSVITDDKDLLANLHAMIGNQKSTNLLDRKVVAKVIAQVEAHTGENLRHAKTDLAAHSSKGLNTQFQTVGGAVFADRVQTLADDVKNTFDIRGEQAELFDVMVDKFVSSYQDRPIHAKDLRQLNAKMGVFARIARNGLLPKQLPDTASETMQKVAQAGNQPDVDVAYAVARRRERLLAELAAFVDGDFAVYCLKDAENFTASLAGGPVTHERIFEFLTGQKAPADCQNLDIDSFSTLLRTAIDEKIEARIIELAGPGTKLSREQMEDIKAKVTAGMNGGYGVLCDMDTAIKLRLPKPNGFNFSLQDSQGGVPAYNPINAAYKGIKGLNDQFVMDLPRNHAILHIGDKTFDCTNVTNETARAMSQQIVDTFKAYFGGETNQMLAVGFSCTQAGNAIAGICPVGGGMGDHTPLEFTVTLDASTGVAKLEVHSMEEPGQTANLNYSYEFAPDGKNMLTGLNYQVQPEAHILPEA